MDLETRLADVIKAEGFRFLEVAGIGKRPELLMLAGAMIGYTLGVKDCHKLVKQINEEEGEKW